MLFITGLIALFFGGPALILAVIHFKNYSSGKTTNERFAKGTAKTEVSDVISESLGSMSDFRESEGYKPKKK